MNYENEIWKDIIIIERNGIIYDYTGLYKVSNYGRVMSCDRVDKMGRTWKGKVLKLQQGNNGYICVGLSKNGKTKTFSVHRLVATMFIPNPENYPMVNHRDECKTNNCLENLEWCTREYNNTYGTVIERQSEKMKGKKNPSAKKVICLETKQVFGCIKDAGEWCHGNVYKCCQDKRKTAGGYHWQYYEDYRREQRKQSDIKNSRLAA